MLTNRDRKQLEELLAIGHALEKAWPSPNPILFADLQARIERLETSAESPDLARLSGQSRHLSAGMSAQHLAIVLVPFERLHGRIRLRDDDIDIDISSCDRTGDQRSARPLTVIADNIRSAFNVGAILRTAEAFGAERVVLTGYSSTPDDAITAKTSMGADTHIPWEAAARASTTIAQLQADGYAIVALETATDAVDLGEFPWPEKCALIVGNERFGIDHDVLSTADHVVRVPLHGIKNSLNVAVALGAALADWRRPRGRDFQPIGVFRADAVHPYEARRQGSADNSGETGTIELSAKRMFEQGLKDLVGFARIWLIYEFHHNRHWKPMVLPPRGPRVKRGVFATRAPYRPNNIGLSCVELVKIDGLRIVVKGFDLLDGTPILDVKPYLPSADAFPEARAGWTEGLERSAARVSFEPLAERQLEWLRENGVTQLKSFIAAQLEYAPLDGARKRVRPVRERETLRHELSYRTWRIDFTTDPATDSVIVLTVKSGYHEVELSNGAGATNTAVDACGDKYADKAVHRMFREQSFVSFGLLE